VNSSVGAAGGAAGGVVEVTEFGSGSSGTHWNDRLFGRHGHPLSQSTARALPVQR